MPKIKVLVFGNPILRDDNLALKLIPRLREKFPKIEFKEFDSTENLKAEGKNLKIIDVAEGINKVEVIADIDKLETARLCSLHDFDLAYNLKLLKKINLIDSVEIICVPLGMDEKSSFEGVSEALARILKSS